MKNALRKKAQSYDELLELCCALTEEQLHETSPSKLDYYKAGITHVKKIFDKSNEIFGEKAHSITICCKERPSANTTTSSTMESSSSNSVRATTVNTSTSANNNQNTNENNHDNIPRPVKRAKTEH